MKNKDSEFPLQRKESEVFCRICLCFLCENWPLMFQSKLENFIIIIAAMKQIYRDYIEVMAYKLAISENIYFVL